MYDSGIRGVIFRDKWVSGTLDTDGEVVGTAAVAELAAFREPFRSSLIAWRELSPE